MSNTSAIPVQTEPYNAVTGNYYGGKNVERLLDAGFESPQWATYKQWLAAGYQVQPRKDVGPGTKIRSYGGNEVKDDGTKKNSFARTFTVHNREQVKKIEGDYTPELPPKARSTERQAPIPFPTMMINTTDLPKQPKPVDFEALADYYYNCFESLNKKAQAKLSDRLENTPKRQREAASARFEGIALERAALLAKSLSSHAKGETFTQKLSMKRLQELTRREYKSTGGCYGLAYEGPNFCDNSAEAMGIRALMFAESEESRKEAERKNEQAKINRMVIPGFFPTPDVILDQLFDLIGSVRGKTVLEPSAGTGAIALRAQDEGAIVDAWEINKQLSDYLTNTGMIECKRCDCLEQLPEDHPKYDYIIMNPPFERVKGIGYQWKAHIDHLRNFLNDDGELWAIIPQNADFNGCAYWDVQGTPFANTNIQTKIVKVLA